MDPQKSQLPDAGQPAPVIVSRAEPQAEMSQSTSPAEASQKTEQVVAAAIAIACIVSVVTVFLGSVIVGLLDPSPRGFFGSSYSTADYVLYPIITTIGLLPLHVGHAAVVALFAWLVSLIAKTHRNRAILACGILTIIVLGLIPFLGSIANANGVVLRHLPFAYMAAVGLVISCWIWTAYFRGLHTKIRNYFGI